MSIESERRWVLVLIQIHQNRIEAGRVRQAKNRRK